MLFVRNQGWIQAKRFGLDGYFHRDTGCLRFDETSPSHQTVETDMWTTRSSRRLNVQSQHNQLATRVLVILGWIQPKAC